MPAVSAIFLVIALVCSVVIGPQTRPWTWGPAMLALGVSVSAAFPTFRKKQKFNADFAIIVLGLIVAGWFAWRALNSPVAELGHVDLLLLAGAVGAFVSIYAIEGNTQAELIFTWGLALLLLANVVAIGIQVIDPAFSPVFRSRGVKFSSGFFASYNEAANYLIASSMMVGATALFGRHATASRILWLVIAIAGLASVWFTRSRGGILGAATACGLLGGMALVIGKRSNSKWFVPALITIPLVAIGAVTFVYMGWQSAQETRQATAGVDQLMDNTIRLYLLGIAISCIELHPWIGGGSQSFSWESYQFLNQNYYGASYLRPEMVHNELMQALTDYGLVGGGLLILLIGWSTLVAVLRTFFSNRSNQSFSADAWRMGGLAALAGMLVQSNFSFVFHMIPGSILFGICLAKTCKFYEQDNNSKTSIAGILFSIAGIPLASLLFYWGWIGIQVTWILWPSYFSKTLINSEESRITALSKAIEIWPQSDLYKSKAHLFHSLINNNKSFELTEQAVRDYQKAFIHNSFQPDLAINLANLLSQLKRNTEAEKWYTKAIDLQGGMEPGFRSHFSAATHFLNKGLQVFNHEDSSPSLEALETAAIHIEEAIKTTPSWIINAEGSEMRISIHENLGTVREAVGDYSGALASYNFATTIPNGSRAHYRAGVLAGKMAALAWADRRPGEALGYFIEAKTRIAKTSELPQGLTPSQRIEYLAYLDQTIGFLKGAKIDPVTPTAPKR